MSPDDIKKAREIISESMHWCYDPMQHAAWSQVIEMALVITPAALDEVARMQRNEQLVGLIEQKHAAECLDYAKDYQILRSETDKLRAENARQDAYIQEQSGQIVMADAELKKLRAIAEAAENIELESECGHISPEAKETLAKALKSWRERK